MITVTKINTSPDLKFCKVDISIFGDDEKKEKIMKILKEASGYIRKLLANRLNLRNTPSLKFVLDKSLEYYEKIDKLIKIANKKIAETDK